MLKFLLGLILGIVFAVVQRDSMASTVPTFDELKVLGAQQSSFKNRPTIAVAAETPEPALNEFRHSVKPVLAEHCIGCHGPEKTKANLRVDTLNPNLLDGGDVDWWLEVMAVLGNGEMPPPEKSELSDEDRAKAIEWLSQEIQMASQVRRATGGHSSFRRMTRYEYNYALQDLLGLQRNFARDLPPEAHSADGFQNSSETLQMSVTQLETYRRLAIEALTRVTVTGPQPSVLYWGVSMEEAAKFEWAKQEKAIRELRDKFKDDPEKKKQELNQLLASFKKPQTRTYFADLSSDRMARHDWSYGGAKYAFKPSDARPEIPESFDQVAILPQGRNQTLIVELGEKIPDEGIMRVRVRASRTSSEGDHIPSLQLEFGWQASNEGRARLRVSTEDIPITAPPDQPEFYQWDIPLGDIYPRNSVRGTSRLGSMPNPSEYIRFVNSSASRGDIQIDYVEVVTPVYEQWPTASHQRIFFDSPNSDDESVYAGEIIKDFMSRAWRRPVTDEDIQQKMRLFNSLREYSDTFDEAVIEVLATVLSSPDFLYLIQGDEVEHSEETAGPKRLSQHELATRLSIFLWCSVPDDRLLELADSGQLSRSDILAGEIGRMLADDRFQRFSERFVHQWLDMQLLDFLKLKRGTDPLLKDAMKQEPIRLFQEMVLRDESVLNFVHAE